MDSNASARTPSSRRAGAGSRRVLFGGMMVALVVVAGLAIWQRGKTSESSGAVSAIPVNSEAAVSGKRMAKGAEPTPEIVKATEANAKYGPHRQDHMPPVPLLDSTLPEQAELTAEADHYAAEHPEVLSYIPCFCGCEAAAHKSNHDCFVRRRAANGDMIEWDEHGADCVICVYVANRAGALQRSGASVPEIREAIDREYGPDFLTMTSTPKPPAHH